MLKIENEILYIYGKKNANVIFSAETLIHSFSINNVNVEKMQSWAKYQYDRKHKGCILFIMNNTPVVLSPQMWKILIDVIDDYLIDKEVEKIKKIS
jgi:gentisate 1,2-dioxygenase